MTNTTATITFITPLTIKPIRNDNETRKRIEIQNKSIPKTARSCWIFSGEGTIPGPQSAKTSLQVSYIFWTDNTVFFGRRRFFLDLLPGLFESGDDITSFALATVMVSLGNSLKPLPFKSIKADSIPIQPPICTIPNPPTIKNRATQQPQIQNNFNATWVSRQAMKNNKKRSGYTKILNLYDWNRIKMVKQFNRNHCNREATEIRNWTSVTVKVKGLCSAYI